MNNYYLFLLGFVFSTHTYILQVKYCNICTLSCWVFLISKCFLLDQRLTVCFNMYILCVIIVSHLFFCFWYFGRISKKMVLILTPLFYIWDSWGVELKFDGFIVGAMIWIFICGLKLVQISKFLFLHVEILKDLGWRWSKKGAVTCKGVGRNETKVR